MFSQVFVSPLGEGLSRQNPPDTGLNKGPLSSVQWAPHREHPQLIPNWRC